MREVEGEMCGDIRVNLTVGEKQTSVEMMVEGADQVLV
jgi:hypothetical protein